jgi:hypothetical protein
MITELDLDRQARIRTNPFAEEDSCYPEKPTGESQLSEARQNTNASRCGCMTPVVEPVSLAERLSRKVRGLTSAARSRGSLNSAEPSSSGPGTGAGEEERPLLRRESSMASQDS